MDLLDIKGAASRPSLISSIWSLQVQPQQDNTTIVDAQMGGSQQSLPDILPCSMIQMDDGYAGGEQGTSMRPTKSLSELSQFSKDARVFRMHEAPSFVWKRSDAPTPQQQSQFRPNADPMLSRQQKERNICEWLEQLNCSDTENTKSSSRGIAISPTVNPNLNFSNSPQLGLPFTTSNKPTPMQH